MEEIFQYKATVENNEKSQWQAEVSSLPFNIV